MTEARWEAAIKQWREQMELPCGDTVVGQCVRCTDIALATALQAAFDAGQQSMLSERVCAQGHAQYASWSHCYLCQNYDAGHAAGVAQERVALETAHRHTYEKMRLRIDRLAAENAALRARETPSG